MLCKRDVVHNDRRLTASPRILAGAVPCILAGADVDMYRLGNEKQQVDDSF